MTPTDHNKSRVLRVLSRYWWVRAGRGRVSSDWPSHCPVPCGWSMAHPWELKSFIRVLYSGIFLMSSQSRSVNRHMHMQHLYRH